MGGLSRCQAESAAAQHGGGEASHDRLCLNVKIPVHFVRAPPAKQTDAVAIHSRAQKGHSTASAGGADGDVGW